MNDDNIAQKSPTSKRKAQFEPNDGEIEKKDDGLGSQARVGDAQGSQTKTALAGQAVVETCGSERVSDEGQVQGGVPSMHDNDQQQKLGKTAENHAHQLDTDVVDRLLVERLILTHDPHERPRQTGRGGAKKEVDQSRHGETRLDFVLRFKLVRDRVTEAVVQRQ